MELTHRIEKVKLHGSGNAAFRLFSAMTGMTPLCLLFSAQFIGRYAEFIGRRYRFISRFIQFTGHQLRFIGLPLMFIGRYAEFIGRRYRFISRFIRFIGHQLRFIGLPLMFIGRHPFITVSACRILQIGPILNYMSQPDKCSVRLRSEMKVKQQL